MRSIQYEDIKACLRFYTRLPIDGASAAPDFACFAVATPIAGAIIGSIAAVVLACGAVAHLPPLVCAVSAISTLVLTTGALHEDGLADVADGFGGGATRETKLAIMRDSRIGAYGMIALNLSLLMRIVALVTIVERGVVLAAATLVWSAALSRVVGLAPMLMLSPARADGLGAAVAPITRGDMRVAVAIAVAMACAPLIAGAAGFQLCIALIGAGVAAVCVARLAQSQIQGYTGDVLGAAQQAAEIAILMALSANG